MKKLRVQVGSFQSNKIQVRGVKRNYRIFLGAGWKVSQVVGRFVTLQDRLPKKRQN